MAFALELNHETYDPGRPGNGIRGLDHLEGSICTAPEWVSCIYRVRPDVPGGKIRRNYDLVWAWIVVTVFSATTGAVATAIATGALR